jgi:hypothetical protein
MTPSLVKSHAQLVGLLLDVSVNATVSGAVPVVTLAVNEATGATVDAPGYFTASAASVVLNDDPVPRAYWNTLSAAGLTAPVTDQVWFS